MPFQDCRKIKDQAGSGKEARAENASEISARQPAPVKPAGKPAAVTPLAKGAAAAKRQARDRQARDGAKAPVSNVEAIKAVAIKAAAKGAFRRPPPPTRAPRPPTARCSTFRMPRPQDDQERPRSAAT